MKYSAVLFDLDDTLLKNDPKQFVKYYFQTLTPHVADYFHPNEFIDLMTGATKAAIAAKRSTRTLREVFADYFERHASIPFAVLEKIANEYYSKDYIKIKAITRPVPGAQSVLNTALKVASHIVLATVPIFPRAAIQERMRWAGVEHVQFSLVTSYEIMHVSKPNPEYYLEICEKLNCRPTSCLMVGNDYNDDMSAKYAGLETFLVTDFASGDKQSGFEPDFSGTMQDLAHFLCKSSL